MSRTIAIIGAGELGSRHLQALVLLKCDFVVYVIDPEISSLERAEQRLREVDSSDDVNANFFVSMDDLPDQIDIAIIATNSYERMLVFRFLAEKRSIAYIVFEKILFPSLDEYSIALDLLGRKSIKAWVNCPRRMMKVFSTFEQYLSSSKPLKFNAAGLNWGMASNTIHLLDTYAMYLNQYSYQLDISDLDNVLGKSKRGNYVEFFGTLSGEFSDGSTFSISCDAGDSWKFTNDFNSDKYSIHCDLGQNQAKVAGVTEKYNNAIELNLERQSVLSHIFIDKIIETAACELPDYEQSMQLHIPMISGLLQHYNKVTGEKVTRLPVT